MPSSAIVRAVCVIVLVVTFLAAADSSGITLNEKEYFEAPGFSFLVFHNNYMNGYQGGLQMIQNGERLLETGDLMLVAKAGQAAAAQRVTRRTVDRADGSATVFGDYGEGNGYRLLCRTDGTRMLVTLILDRPIDWNRFEQAGLRFTLYPGAYMSKSYQADNGGGVFPRQFTGARVLVASTGKLRVAQEEPLRSMRIDRVGGTMSLADNRSGGPAPWFVVLAPIAAGSQETRVELAITPTIDPSWRRPTVIGISQIGYHPTQTKRAVLELDPRDAQATPVTLLRMSLDGGAVPVKKAASKPWGKFLRYRYEIFDFSDVRQPGEYVIEARGVRAGPFRIDASIYRQAWKPTLQYFLPVQMCHVSVREGLRTWHGACHLDDARQAPANTTHLDGYQQSKIETRFAAEEHIPGLDWGGWHDAGDLDVAAGSLARTALYLALAEEEFHPQLDEMSLDRARREVLLHTPDGKQDLIQQVEYGVEGMLASYRTAGYIFPGIIERARSGYSHLGDPVNITDNKVDPAGAKNLDDRWAFTNRNTGLQYNVAQSLAASSRVLRDTNPALADESLKTARALFDYEQQREPVYARNAYTPQDSGFRSEEIIAAAELLITTGDRRYADRLQALLPELKKASAEQWAGGPGWVLARALPVLPGGEVKQAVLDAAARWKKESDRLAASNPYGMRFPDSLSNPEFRLEDRTGIHSNFVWGAGWNMQTDALHQYYLNKHIPLLFDAEPLLAVVNYVLGCHPANNMSFVSGVGANSSLVAYGINRAEWSHIPGGVISGASLIKPDFMELKDFPFLWYQTEYVMHGAASYIFDVLAADRLLNK